MIIKTVFLLSSLLLLSSARVKIGRVSGPGEDVRLTSEEFWSYSSHVSLEPITQRVHWWNTLDVATAVCKLSEQRVHAFVFDGPPRMRNLLSAYSEHMQVPSIGGTISVVPDTSEAAAQLLQQWKTFIFIYQTNEGPNQLQNILRLMNQTPKVEAFFRMNGADEIIELSKSLPQIPILLACSKSLADELISKLAILRKSFDIMLLTPVGRVTKRLHPGSYRFIQFSYMEQQDSSALKDFEHRWNTIRGSSKPELSDSAVVNHEASKVLQKFFSADIIKPPLETLIGSSCFNYSAGISPRALKQVETKGFTGDIKFDEEGNRIENVLDIYEEMPFDLKKIGTWSDAQGLKMLHSTRQVTPVSAAYQQGPPIRVTSVLTKPFLFMGPSGNFEGYVVDLLEELMSILQLPYRIQLSKDGAYGYLRGSFWTGMIGELVRNEADMCVSPLTKTTLRETAVDFSKSFMTFGLNVVLKRPDDMQHETTTFSPFGFVTVWSAEMWIVVMLCILVLGGVCYLISRYIGPPDRVRALESKGTDNLSPCGSFWYTLASMVQRDAGIYPRTFSHRSWACLWWGLCFFLALGYVSYLNADLIKTRRNIVTTYSRKTSHEVLQDLMEKGTPDIGVINGGSTMQFFLNSNVGLYQRIGRYLEKNPAVMEYSYDNAAERVRQSGGSYAFIMESPSSQHHANSKPCDIIVTPGYLTTKLFAVALQKNSVYKDVVDHAILVLTERGTLRSLYEKWWHNTSDTSCQDPNMDILPKVYNRSLKLHEVSGAFYVLILLACISVAGAFVEKKFSASKHMTLD